MHHGPSQLLGRKPVWIFLFFFSSSALASSTSNCRRAWLPHQSSCGYIQTLTSAPRSPNMCCYPVKKTPSSRVVEGFCDERDTLWLSQAEKQTCFPPLVECSGRIRTVVVSLTAGLFYLKRPFEVPLWQRVGGEIIQMPLQAVTRSHSPSKGASLRKLCGVHGKGSTETLWTSKPCALSSPSEYFTLAVRWRFAAWF